MKIFDAVGLIPTTLAQGDLHSSGLPHEFAYSPLVT